MALAFDLQDFLLRARVLKLYRQSLRVTRRAPVHARGHNTCFKQNLFVHYDSVNRFQRHCSFACCIFVLYEYLEEYEMPYILVLIVLKKVVLFCKFPLHSLNGG